MEARIATCEKCHRNHGACACEPRPLRRDLSALALAAVVSQSSPNVAAAPPPPLDGIAKPCPNCHNLAATCACPVTPPAPPPNTLPPWSELTGRQKFFAGLGYLFASIISIGSGITTAAAFMTLHLVSGGLATFLLAALIFSAGAAMNWYINKNAVPLVLVQIFGQKKLFEGLMEYFPGKTVSKECDLFLMFERAEGEKPENSDYDHIRLYKKDNELVYYINGKEHALENKELAARVYGLFSQEAINPQGVLKRNNTLTGEQRHDCETVLTEANKKINTLSTKRKAWMWFGILLAIAVGLTNALLTYGSTFSLSTAFGFLAAISPAFPSIAGVLAGVTLVCLAALMLKNIAKLIKNRNLWNSTKSFWETCKKFWKEDLFCLESRLVRDKGKTPQQIRRERIVTVILLCIALPLAGLGLFMTMRASAGGAKIFFLKNIPEASAKLVDIVSKVLTLGLALLGRIVFTFNNSLQFIRKIFGAAEKTEPSSWAEKELAALCKRKPVHPGALAGYYFKFVLLYSLCIINAIGNGLISIVGAILSKGEGGQIEAEAVVAGIGGTLNSFCAGADNINVKKPVGELEVERDEFSVSSQEERKELLQKDRDEGHSPLNLAHSSEIPASPRSPSSPQPPGGVDTRHPSSSSAESAVQFSKPAPVLRGGAYDAGNKVTFFALSQGQVSHEIEVRQLHDPLLGGTREVGVNVSPGLALR